MPSSSLIRAVEPVVVECGAVAIVPLAAACRGERVVSNPTPQPEASRS